VPDAWHNETARDVRRAIPLKARRRLSAGQLQDDGIDLRSLNASE
jgi:hypothetical protein